ncbi:MAG: hypothetical protein ACOC1K_03565 [Nanoarchaeota archaeon]
MGLHPLEIRYMENSSNQELRVSQVDIKYIENDNWNSGHGDTSKDESDYEKYWCTINRVSQKDIEKYPFGNIEEGDIILLIPKDTNLPTDKNEYKIKINDDIFTNKTGIKEEGFVGDTFLYYVLIASL